MTNAEGLAWALCGLILFVLILWVGDMHWKTNQLNERVTELEGIIKRHFGERGSDKL